MSLIKVCGFTNPEQASQAVASGVDLVGLNFWPGSPRWVSPELGREIAARVAGRARVVGVFVGQAQDEVAAIDAAVGLDLLQFHGDEAAAELAPWGRRAIKVVRVGAAPPAGLVREYDGAWGFLFDVRHPDFGGTGESWDYGMLAGLNLGRPFLVAGGVRPDTARAALAASGATGVDVCSGVESAPGLKDAGLIARLVKEVRDGEELIPRRAG